MLPRSCETSTMVLPRALNSWILPTHRCWKASSPTARTSSIRRTSGSTVTAIANPSRMYIPDEYVLTGLSTKASRPANATISSNRARISARVRPSSTPLM